MTETTAEQRQTMRAEIDDGGPGALHLCDARDLAAAVADAERLAEIESIHEEMLAALREARDCISFVEPASALPIDSDGAINAIEAALQKAASGTAATRAEELGYDGMREMEALPEILDALTYVPEIYDAKQEDPEKAHH